MNIEYDEILDKWGIPCSSCGEFKYYASFQKAKGFYGTQCRNCYKKLNARQKLKFVLPVRLIEVECPDCHNRISRKVPDYPEWITQNTCKNCGKIFLGISERSPSMEPEPSI